MDYKHITKDATLTSNESQVCMIIIRARIDLIYENDEVFGVNLSIDASASLRVRLGTQKTVCIRDGDSKLEITDLLILMFSPRLSFHFYIGRACNIKVKTWGHKVKIFPLLLTGAVVSLVNTTIMQNEGDGDVSVCARLDSPVGGTEKEIFITLNSSQLI